MEKPQAQMFSFRPTPVIAELLATKGIDVVALLRAAELPPEAANGEITAPLARIQKFLDLCADHANMPLIGMDIAERVPRGMFGVMEFVVRASPTVKQGLEALCEFAPLLNPLNNHRYVADQRGCEVHMAYGAFRDCYGAQLNEYTVTVVARQFAVVLGTPLPIERAWFAHSRTAHGEEVAQRLGCSVRFQAADCGFAVAPDVLDRTVAGGEPALFQFLLQQARAQLAHIGKHDIVAQVVRTLEARFGVQDISAEAVADAMSTTARSLQRHLAEAGTTFREVIAHVRRRRRAELEAYNLSESEIATRLGFSSARAMRRSLDGAD